MKLEVVSTLKDGLQLLKENPKILVPLTASVVLWLLVVVSSYSIGLEHDTTEELLKALTLLLLIWFAAGTLGYFLDNAAIRVAADITLSGETCLKDALLFTLRKLPALLAAGFIYMLIVVPASLLIVPGIYLGVRFFFFSYAVLIDNESAIGSLKKSWKIAKGNWLRMFALLAVFAVIGFPLGYLLEIENLLLWTVACAGMMFVRGWAIASLTLAYLQLAPESENEVEERSTRPEESLELQQRPKPKLEIEKRPIKDEKIEVLKQRRGDFSLSKEISPEDEIESGESTTMEMDKELEEEKSSGYVGFAEQTLKAQVNIVTTSTAEEKVNGVKIEGLGLRRKRARKSGIEHETDKNESQKENEEERAEEESRENTKDDESSLDGISIILRRD